MPGLTSPFHFGVNLRGIHFEDWHLTVKLAAGITASDIGKAMSWDGNTANTVKLAGNGDIIIGRLATVENRSVEGQLIGTVAFKFADTLPVKSGETVNVGETVIGAGSGEVKALANTTNHNDNVVVERVGALAVVVKF